MREFCLKAIKLLDSLPINKWAEEFVSLRMQFVRQYQKNLINSTSHGIDFFYNVLNCLNGEKWEEEGEYGDNFRKLIQIGKKEASKDLEEITKLQKGVGN